MTLVSANDLDFRPNKTAIQDALAHKFDLITVVSSYAHGMTQSIMNPVLPPEPWYASLVEHVGAAKVNAQKWLATSPQIGARAPESFIAFNTTFRISMGKIAGILQSAMEGRRSLTNAEKLRVLDQIELIVETLDDQTTNLNDVVTRMTSIHDAFAVDHARLTDGQNGAAAALRIAEQEKTALEAKIRDLDKKLDEARLKVTAAHAGLGIATCVLLFGLAITGVGSSLAFGLGVIGQIGSSYAMTAFGREVVSIMTEIETAQASVTEKVAQIRALSGLIHTVSRLRDDNEKARGALTPILTTLGSLQDKLGEASKWINGARGADEILLALHIPEALAGWQETADFAKKMQLMASGAVVDPTIVYRRPRAA